MQTEGTQNQNQQTDPRWIVRSIPLAVALSFLTLGIYYLIWQAHQMNVVNSLIGEDKHSFWKWFIFSLLTFGLYHIFHEWVMGNDLVDIQKRYNRNTTEHLPLVSMVLAIAGIPIVADAIQQYEMNRLVNTPSLPAGAHA